jgi:hypothetical protein
MLNKYVVIIAFSACLCAGLGALSGAEVGKPPKLSLPASMRQGSASRTSQRKNWRNALDHCLHLAVSLRQPPKTHLYGKVLVRNECSFPAAILTAPAQTYFRRSSKEFFVPDTIVDPVYVALYVFRRDLGIGPSSFLGDGGLEVNGLPIYTAIPAHSTRGLSLIDKKGLLLNLPAGEYGIVLTTSVSPAIARDGSERSYIDLGLDVSKFNQESRAAHPGEHRKSERISSAATFFQIPR